MTINPALATFENPLDGLLGYHLRRASAMIHHDLAQSLGGLGLRVAEVSVLLLIAANPGITQSEIGRMLGIKRANMAPIAALLSERGLIDRSRPDGRSQGLRLSAEGVELAHEVRLRIETHEARFVPDLAPEARAALVALVRSMWTR